MSQAFSHTFWEMGIISEFTSKIWLTVHVYQASLQNVLSKTNLVQNVLYKNFLVPNVVSEKNLVLNVLYKNFLAQNVVSEKI